MTQAMRLFLVLACLYRPGLFAQQVNHDHGLYFPALPERWDEAIPLGNGLLGALVWQKAGRVHVSLDRADLWDNRQAMDLGKLSYRWVREKWMAGSYDSVQKIGDEPYDVIPYPTKIPAAALEFDGSLWGSVLSVRLDIQSAMCRVRWRNGTVLETFVAATKASGYFRFTHLSGRLTPQLVPPPYHPDSAGSGGGPVEGPSLQRLGYIHGTLIQTKNGWIYHQPTTRGNGFVVSVNWVRQGDQLTGYWTIKNDWSKDDKPAHGSYDAALRLHKHWWVAYWSRCSLRLPDTLMEKQWYLERYKLGCVARKDGPPITLQGVWTADEGRLPPWKGDVHNDLNTQLSYWSTFSGNYKEGAASFTDWLWSIRGACRAYTTAYFGTAGINVPGVSTLAGAPMGGWIQYSLGPTVGAWLAQDFHQEWLYWRDPYFLKTRAYPYLFAVATYLEQVTLPSAAGRGRSLPLSASPEIFDNSPRAWFPVNTNFDESLMIFLFRAAAREATALGKLREAAHWSQLAGEMNPPDTDSTGLTIAPGFPLPESHRHMSPYMAIYPLGLLTPDLPLDKTIIERSLTHLGHLGTRAWVGYSFCWAACLFARAYHGDSAARYLKIFVTNFCSSNSFHLNGDQRGGQYADATYRPFTLEGNFAYAAGVQEMLLQSYNGYIRIFPALPAAWKDVSFHHLRAEGGYLINASLRGGHFLSETITATVSGEVRLRVPSTHLLVNGLPCTVAPDGLLSRSLRAGETLQIKAEE